MKKHLPFLLLAGMLSICGCMFFTSTTTMNDRIAPAVRAEIAPLNKKLFECLAAKNVKGVKQLMSKGLLDSAGSNIDTIINTVGGVLRSKKYTILDEFYTSNAPIGSGIILKSNKGSVNDYTIQYNALNSKMYVVLLKSEGLAVNIAVLAVYGKYDEGWKLNIISANNYDILGKTAPEYYATALEKYRKGDTIDATSNIILASQAATPGGKYLAYNDNDDMKTFYESAIAEANSTYHFPITVKQVKTQPQIFAIVPKLVDTGKYMGFYPVIKYKSTINLSDTVALKAENIALQKAIGTLFKGITEDKKCIIYRAFNQVPDGKTPVRQYGFVEYLQ